MNQRIAMIFAGLAALSASAVLILLRPAAPPPTSLAGSYAPGWLTSLNRETILGVQTTHVDGVWSRISRSEILGGFVLTQSQAGTPAWPVQESRVLAAASLLSEAAANGTQAPVENGQPLAYTCEWLLARDVQGKHTITFGDASLGGRALMQTAGASLLINRDVLAMLSPQSLAAWRTPLVLPAMALAEPTMMQVSAPGYEVTLRLNADQTWTVDLLDVAASAQAAAGLIRRATLLAATRFMGVPEAGMGWSRDVASGRGGPAPGASSPTFMLTVHSTGPGGADGHRAKIVQAMRVYAAADSKGDALACVSTVEHDGQAVAGPMLLVAAREQVEAISADPLAYVSRIVCPGADSEVRGIRAWAAAQGREFTLPAQGVTQLRRTGAGAWGFALDGKEPAAAASGGDVSQAAIARLLDIILRLPAIDVTLDAPAVPSGGAVYAVEIDRFVGGMATRLMVMPIGRQTIVLANGKKAEGLLAIRRGRVSYIYDADAAAAVVTAMELLCPTEG